MPAQDEEIEAAEREGIVVRDGLVPTEVVGRDGAVVALRVRRHAANRRRPPPGGRSAGHPTGVTRELPAPSILVAIGEEPDPSILPEGAGIEVSGWAGIVADPRTLATGRAGIFAGGDVVSGPKTIIEAVAAGRRAAASIHEYLAGAPDGEAEILAAVRYPTPPEATLSLDLAVRPRVHAALPVVDTVVVRRHRARLHGGGGPRRGVPLLPLRRRLRVPVRQRPSRVADRPTAGPRAHPRPGGPSPPTSPSQGGVQ